MPIMLHFDDMGVSIQKSIARTKGVRYLMGVKAQTGECVAHSPVVWNETIIQG